MAPKGNPYKPQPSIYCPESTVMITDGYAMAPHNRNVLRHDGIASCNSLAMAEALSLGRESRESKEEERKQLAEMIRCAWRPVHTALVVCYQLHPVS